MQRRRRRRLSVNQSFNFDAQSPSKSQESSENVSFVDLGENDDRAERTQLRKSARRSRRKSLVGMATPVRSSRRSRRGSASPRVVASGRKQFNYTNDQLSQIYKDCIEKAQRGKINQQNAWNLHLVDNIQQITSLRPSAAGGGGGGDGSSHRSRGDAPSASDANEFARASHTIDAASKIYGYRVDSVHSKMYTVLNSIHQQSGDRGGGGADGDAAQSEESGRRRRARNRNMGRSTLCEADKAHKINESMKNLCVEVDALFHKTASCFDEGGAKGLLMNTLYVQNGCDIVFDSSTTMEHNEDITREGVRVDVSAVEDAAQIEREQQWMTQLVAESFGKEAAGGGDSAFDGFTQIEQHDLLSQTKPQHFEVDLEWMEKTALCPLLNAFQRNIEAVSRRRPAEWEGDGRGDGAPSSERKQPQHASPEKDLHQGGDGGLDDFGDDDDVVLDILPDFTIGGDAELNAQDLFHEELLTQQVAPVAVQQQRGGGGESVSAINVRNLSNLQLDPGNMSAANLEYVVGQNNQNIVGNIGVQPALNVSWVNDNERIIGHLNSEQQNEQFSQLHRGGIYKRGAMNLAAMNSVISKLENADFENLTSFFDQKKHGNWAGPDQWYHRRYQLTLAAQKNRRRAASSEPSTDSASRASQAANAGDANGSGAARPRRERRSKWIDFMTIAGGQLIEEKEFVEPQRSHNTLTQGVLDRNRKSNHSLPKDLRIKPDLFIKLFHRPNYSVWKHWLNQHKLRMLAKKKQDGDGAVAGDGGRPDGGDGGAVEQGQHRMAMADDTALPMAMAVMECDSDPMQQMAAMQQMAQFEDGGGDDDEFQYNYQNPLDVSHFVPDLGGDHDADDANHFDFNLNGYDLIDVDPDRKVEKIQVEYAVKAKKVNVRKLKLKLWDRIDVDILSPSASQSRSDSKSVAAGDGDEEDDDVEMDSNDGDGQRPQRMENKEESEKVVTFQDSLTSLPTNISSAISVQMCFICLLHLANEKELQFVPTVKSEHKAAGRGDFEIQYANENSEFEREAQKTNTIMIL